MRKNSTVLAVAALLLCCACTGQTMNKTSQNADSSVVVSSIHWDEVTAGTPTRVSNGNLIFMR